MFKNLSGFKHLTQDQIDRWSQELIVLLKDTIGKEAGSIEEYINVAYAAGATLVTLDKLIPFQLETMQPGSAALLVGQLHGLGFNVTTYTVDTEPEWQFMSVIGIDGIYKNNISMGLILEGSAP
mgnify:CR=1 FL=1